MIARRISTVNRALTRANRRREYEATRQNSPLKRRSANSSAVSRRHRPPRRDTADRSGPALHQAPRGDDVGGIGRRRRQGWSHHPGDGNVPGRRLHERRLDGGCGESTREREVDFFTTSAIRNADADSNVDVDSNVDSNAAPRRAIPRGSDDERRFRGSVQTGVYVRLDGARSRSRARAVARVRPRTTRPTARARPALFRRLRSHHRRGRDGRGGTSGVVSRRAGACSRLPRLHPGACATSNDNPNPVQFLTSRNLTTRWWRPLGNVNRTRRSFARCATTRTKRRCASPPPSRRGITTRPVTARTPRRGARWIFDQRESSNITGRTPSTPGPRGGAAGRKGGRWG